jgi:hypothetical protein
MKGTWDGEGELNEEIEMELIEKRCVDLTKGTLQVSTHTSECKPEKVRKSNVCDDRGIQQFPSTTVEGRGVESRNQRH